MDAELQQLIQRSEALQAAMRLQCERARALILESRRILRWATHAGAANAGSQGHKWLLGVSIRTPGRNRSAPGARPGNVTTAG